MGKYLSVASWLLLSGGLMVSLPATVAAQNVPGVSGTIQPDSGRGDVDAAGHIVGGGLKSIFRGKEGDDDWLKQLREGTPVSLRYASKGSNAVTVKPERDVTDDPITEGTVTEVDRKAKTIVIRFPNKSRQTFRLAANQPADAKQEMVPGPDEVVVSFLDQAGRRIGRNFKKAS